MTMPASDATSATPIRSHLRETSGGEGVELDEGIRPTLAGDRPLTGALHRVRLTRDRAHRSYGGGPGTWGIRVRVRLLDVLRGRTGRVRPRKKGLAATRRGAGRESRRIGRRQAE